MRIRTMTTKALALGCGAVLALTTAAVGAPDPEATATVESDGGTDVPEIPGDEAVSDEPSPSEDPADPTPDPTLEDPAPDPEDSAASEEVEDGLSEELMDDLESDAEVESRLMPMSRSATGLPGHSEVVFSSPKNIGRGWPSEGVIYPGDWDKNGHDDMMLVKPDGTLLYYAGYTSTKFRYPRKIGTGWNNYNLILGGVDWNRDGNLDLIARHNTGQLRVFYGNGRGGFAGSRAIGQGWNGMRLMAPIQKSIGNVPAVAAVDGSGTLHLYTSNGRGSFNGRTTIGRGWSSMTHLIGAGDWNGSGRTDLLSVDSRGYLRLYEADKRGTGFSGFQIGRGWSLAHTLGVANQSGINAHVWVIWADGRLADYPVRVRKAPPQPSDSLIPGKAIPWSGQGWTQRVPGSQAGKAGHRKLTYQVEVEAGLPVNAEVFATQVHSILNDRRGWSRNFTRVSSGGQMRVILASPALVDRLCAPLDTNGYTSCRRGDKAIINIRRWAYSTEPFLQAGGNLTQYRQYVINHEVGHVLGNGHRQCPGPGRLAPVMQQQTLFVKPCRPNPWPNP